MSTDGAKWLLLNVSPDIRAQILGMPPSKPTGQISRATNIGGCILTDAEIDHTLGLFLLREGGDFGIASTPLVRSWLNRFFSLEETLKSFVPRVWHHLPLGEAFECSSFSESFRDLTVRAFALEDHTPRFVANDPGFANVPLEGSVIGLVIEDRASGSRMVYAPCVASVHPALVDAVSGADAVFLDGTFWSDDELVRLGGSDRTARRMGHLPVSGPEGSLAWFAAIPARHRVYIHINNTNPMLNERGQEYGEVARAGVRVGADGDLIEI